MIQCLRGIVHRSCGAAALARRATDMASCTRRNSRGFRAGNAALGIADALRNVPQHVDARRAVPAQARVNNTGARRRTDHEYTVVATFYDFAGNSAVLPALSFTLGEVAAASCDFGTLLRCTPPSTRPRWTACSAPVVSGDEASTNSSPKTRSGCSATGCPPCNVPMVVHQARRVPPAICHHNSPVHAVFMETRGTVFSSDPAGAGEVRGNLLR